MQQMIGHYRIVSELGRGGMGVVYKAHEESLNRHVAIKMLGSHLAEDPAYVERFVREAQSAAGLNHPNIVQIYAIGEHEGQHYFVMEYVTGTSLQQLLRSHGRMPQAAATDIILQAAAGLQAAHDRGIIHRDVKPANLIIDDRGLVKIADFGLALPMGGAASRLTATGMMMGTPGYLSPEQCRDEKVDERTDIYSLGVTYFEALSGRMPFTADSPLALIRQIVDVEPPDIRELNPDVEPPVRQILHRMMAKDRDQRYPSCRELADDLRAAASQSRPGSGMAAAVPPPPPGAGHQPHDQLNVEPTIAVASGAASAPVPPATTDPVPVSTEPAAVATRVAPPAATRVGQPAATRIEPPVGTAGTVRRRPMLLVAIVILVLAVLTATAGAVVLWKSGLVNRIIEHRARARAAGQQIASTAGTAATGAIPPSETGPSQQPPVQPPADRLPPVEIRPTEPASSVAELPPVSRPTTDVKQPGSRPVATPRIVPKLPTTPAAAAVQPTAAPPRTAATGTVVIAVGESLLAGEVESYIERALAQADARLVDEHEFPAVESMLGENRQVERGALREALRAHARHVILARAEYLGDRPLSYMGRSDAAFRARLTVVAIDLEEGRLVGNGFNRQVEYTHLTVERVVADSLRPWLRGLLRAGGER